ncbi:MAG TPA: CGNR zinc finger domain-containing protein [Marmoricola sp.]
MAVKRISDPMRDEELLVALANTGHDETDELADGSSVKLWWQRLDSSDPQVPTGAGTADDLRRLRAARDLVRAVALRNNGVAAEAEIGALDGTPLQFDWTDGPVLRAPGAASLPQYVVGAAVLALVRASARPGWSRVKACRGPDCGWVFVDRSRNGSRRWCQMSECGNRAKAAAFRARARQSARR